MHVANFATLVSVYHMSPFREVSWKSLPSLWTPRDAQTQTGVRAFIRSGHQEYSLGLCKSGSLLPPHCNINRAAVLFARVSPTALRV